MNKVLKYSVVIPVYNEEKNIIPLCEDLIAVMEEINELYEVVLVDDGSFDGSYLKIMELRKKYSSVKSVKLARNYGQTAAFWAGISHARGKFIITLDGDRQNDPADIPRLLSHLDRYDLICGWRKNRRDKLWKRFQSRFANRCRTLVLHDGIKDIGCSLKAFRKPKTTLLPPFEGLHRFLPVLLKQQGYKTHQIPVNHLPRIQGETKYTCTNRMFRSFRDLLAVKWMVARRFDPQMERFDD